jgi:hypothetical protein
MVRSASRGWTWEVSSYATLSILWFSTRTKCYFLRCMWTKCSATSFGAACAAPTSIFAWQYCVNTTREQIFVRLWLHIGRCTDPERNYGNSDCQTVWFGIICGRRKHANVHTSYPLDIHSVANRAACCATHNSARTYSHTNDSACAYRHTDNSAHSVADVGSPGGH